MNDMQESIVLFSKEKPQLRGLIRSAVINTLVLPIWIFFSYSDTIPDMAKDWRSIFFALEMNIFTELN